MINKKRAIIGPLLSIIFLIFFACVISGVQWVFENISQNNISRTVASAGISNAVTGDISQNAAKNIIQAAPDLEINSNSAISVESNLSGADKIIFEKNGEAKLPIASLTKLMTAVVVLDNYNLSDTWQIDKVADSQDPMKQDIKLGDTMTVKSLLEIMLVESSNKSAYALSELIGEQKFIELMNQKAKDFNLQNTFFVDPTGLSPEDVSTANDLAKLAEYILKNYSQIAEISQTKDLYVDGFGNAVNTDQLLGEIPEIVCSKTGFTPAANGCLLLVINNPKNSDYLINVILGANDRFSEMKKLVSWSSAACN